MRYLLALSVFCLALESTPAHAHGADNIGFQAGRDMASRLWSGKYHQDCFRSDRFFSELNHMQSSLSGSRYHQGYRRGMEGVESEVAQTCHSTQTGDGGEPAGECPQTGLQHGNNLGAQVCNDTIMSLRMINTCRQQALAHCFDGLKTFVRNNCPNKFSGISYRKAEQECQQTFARR